MNGFERHGVQDYRGEETVYENSNESAKKIGVVIVCLLLPVATGLGVGIVTRGAIFGVIAGIAAGTIVLGLVVLMVARKNIGQTPTEPKAMGVGIAIGMGLGVAYGLILGIAMDNPAFFSIGIALGGGTGVAIGSALDARNKKRDG